MGSCWSSKPKAPYMPYGYAEGPVPVYAPPPVAPVAATTTTTTYGGPGPYGPAPGFAPPPVYGGAPMIRY